MTEATAFRSTVPSEMMGRSAFAEPMRGGTGRLLPVDPDPSHVAHLRRLGGLPALSLTDLLALISVVGVSGRGGAGFPLARKVAAVAAQGRRPVIVANGNEGDPTSMKDRTMIVRSPHLIVDGAMTLAAALNAERVVLTAHDGTKALQVLRNALRERGTTGVFVVGVPDRFVASEASSLVNFLNTGDARPLGRLDPIWERGVGGAPTLVANAETLADVALLARFGAEWFAAVGTRAEPGTTLVTVRGPGRAPMLVEAVLGTPIRSVLAAAGVPAVGEALIGGLAGTWVDLGKAADIPWSSTDLHAAGISRGVGSITVLPPGGCLLKETARIVDYLAGASAGQCGPCMFGLPAIAGDLAGLIAGDRSALDRLQRRLPVITGRGGCAHPDGTVALVSSAMSAMTTRGANHLRQHLLTGGCHAPQYVVPIGRG